MLAKRREMHGTVKLVCDVTCKLTVAHLRQGQSQCLARRGRYNVDSSERLGGERVMSKHSDGGSAVRKRRKEHQDLVSKESPRSIGLAKQDSARYRLQISL